MDPQTTLLTALMIAVTIAPFAISGYLKRTSTNRLLKSLQELAIGSSCKITDYEVCGNYIIGMDDHKQVMFFIQKRENDAYKATIVLSKLLQCKKVNESRTVKDNGSNYTVVERIALHFIFNERTMPDQQLELFTLSSNSKPSGEIQSMDRWHAKIDSMIKR